MTKHFVTLLGLIAALAVGGCGGGGGANIPEGPMPQGGSFTGVWHSPQYGRMEMTQTGGQVVGTYEKDERRGRIQGTVHGNVMRFEWSESREMVVGRPVTTRGRGYFRYQIDAAGDHVIQGEWGVDDNSSGGGVWEAVRDRRARPGQATTATSGGDESVTEFDRPDDGASTPSRAPARGGSGSGLDLDGL
ncbi:MAG: hypothetical protein KF729_21800 [Sandaracinaceae bacterium]|nr:hypothetical protein [Sandaracinaceae bacterium]